jgi:Fe-S cluster biosynthesis and repair protein YggX
MGLFGSDKFECTRCGRKGEPLSRAPLPTDLGARIAEEICSDCWAEWLEKQKQIINHFGLDLSNPDSHDYLFDQMKLFFFDEGSDLAVIDESKEGSISW